MEDIYYNNRPLGAVTKEIQSASLAETVTSEKIVSDDDADAVYFRALEKKGILLNRSQIEAVRHFKGPLLTLAGAGSGKTSVLVSRTGYLISVHRVPARHILLVTFTKKAADGMKERIANLPGLSRKEASQVQARTFHSFFLTLLKGSGYNQEILSNERYKQLIIKKLLREIGIDDNDQPETYLSLFSYYKMNLVTGDQLPSKTPAEKEIRKLYFAYEKWKQDNNQLDFDDILLESYHLLDQSPSLLKSLQDRFSYIMVDEFQDTNLLQYELVKMIAKYHGNLFVVGDDDQTIYSFNGAKNEFILNFDKEFPGTKIVTLDINYRSTCSIVGLGNQVIKYNKERKTKTLQAMKQRRLAPQFSRPSTTDEEAELIVQAIKEKVSSGSYCYRDFAILHRTSSNSRAIFEQLTLEKIPFVDHAAGYQIFYEQWPVKTVISYLRLALEPRDFEAIEEIVPTLYVNRQKGIEHITANDSLNLTKYPLIHLKSLPFLKDFQIKKITERVRFIKELKILEPITAVKQIRRQFYDDFLDTNDRQNATLVKESIKEGLDELESSAKRFNTIASFITFVDEMIQKHIEMRTLIKDHVADAVTLMTIHRSKGLEFPNVYIIGASDGILPHITALEASKMEDMVSKEASRAKVQVAIEEERRLMYVAITRAKEGLYISSPSYYRGKKAAVSQFLLEAFGKEEAPSKGTVKVKTIVKKSANDVQSETNRDGYKVTVLAWICTSHTCNGWQRIVTQEETKIKQKDCPLCEKTMEQGVKEVW